MTIRQPLHNENQLVESAQQGMLEAFTSLYEYYLPIVYNRVRYLIPQEDIEDVTQEIFIATMRSLKSFRGESKFSTWLRTLTNRQVAEYYRRKRHPETEISEQIQAPHNPATTDEAIMLRQALRKLPKKYQEVLLLRFVEEMPFDEIAHHLGHSLEATKSLFRRAVSALQKRATSDDR
jgi:RNA polymerase sigma-70 factor (ECF subfamily)